MMKNWCLQPETRDALVAIEKAEWETRHALLCTHGLPVLISEAQWGQRVPEGEWWRVPFKSMRAEESCTFSLDGLFHSTDREGLFFGIRDWEAMLRRDGTVKIGCQEHPLDAFLPGGQAERVSSEIRAVPEADRIALVEALRARLVSGAALPDAAAV